MKPEPVSNNKLTLLRKLHQKKYRQQKQLFLIEGGRAVQQILKNGKLSVKELFFDEGQVYWEQNYWKHIAERLSASVVAHPDFTEVSDTDSPQGVLAMCEIPVEISPEQIAQQAGLVLAVDAIQDPGNLGTIIRTASWFGVQSLLCGKGTVDLFHPKVVRSTAGATGTVPHANVELEEAIPVFEEAGWSVVMLDAAPDAVPLREIPKKEKMLVVVGSEAHGIDPSLVDADRQKVRIASPRNKENVESLNAAIATAVALYVLA